jgi:hypothetical protein
MGVSVGARVGVGTGVLEGRAVGTAISTIGEGLANRDSSNKLSVVGLTTKVVGAGFSGAVTGIQATAVNTRLKRSIPSLFFLLILPLYSPRSSQSVLLHRNKPNQVC